MKVLVVDDEEEIRDSLQEFLNDEGYAVSLAANGAEALSRLEHEPQPCVVILDLLMPTLSGSELYSRMQADKRWANIPIIISTSDPTRAPSGSLIMKKPINLDRLLDFVQRYCKGSQS